MKTKILADFHALVSLIQSDLYASNFDLCLERVVLIEMHLFQPYNYFLK